MGHATQTCAAGRRDYLSTKMNAETPSRRRSTAEPPEVPRGAAGDALALLVVLARANAAVTRHLEADTARHGLTLTEFGILEALYHKGPLLLGEIQRAILVSSGGITYLVDRLTAKGLVERQECATDRRARYAVLTDEGEALIRRIFPEHARVVARALSGLTPEQHRALRPLLRQLGQTAAELPLPASDGG